MGPATEYPSDIRNSRDLFFPSITERYVKTLLWLFFLFRQQPFVLLGDKAVWQKHKPFLSKDEVVTANNVPAFPKDVPMLSIYEVILQ